MSINRLLTKAPTTVLIDGVEYDINIDFRDCLHTIEQLQDPYYLSEEKIDILIYNMYLEDPPNQEEAIKKALWFLRCGEEPKDKNDPKLLDFAQDSKYIYGAFLKANIDLDCEDIHWWKFLSRLPELPESMFSRIVYLRSQRQKGKLSKEEEKECARIGRDVIDIREPLDDALDDAIQAAFAG